MAFIVWLLSLLLSAPPPIQATWERPGVARITWIQPANVVESCLIRKPNNDYPRLVTCLYNVPPGPNTLLLGNKGPLDASYKPQGGDTFIMRFDNSTQYTVISAPLRSIEYFPVFRR